MKYKELVNFDPITTIVQLTDAKDLDKAKKLVETYVVSDTMQVQLTDIIFRELDPDCTDEHKGILVVGNYGTGKSHLMSFISSIAEDASLVPSIRNAAVREAASRIAGKYNVIRTEIGGVTTKFRDILVDRLQRHLDDVGVDFTIPVDDSKLTNNKEWLRDMMVAYRAKFPKKGLVIFIDEMLDYLRSLPHGTDLVLAFGVMRELGEFANMRDGEGNLYGFHFVGGVQEAIFESGSFQFVSESIARVAERFRQLKIARNDVEFVVAERLLKKDPGQLAKVEEHLSKFTSCYETLTPRLEKFKRLFPVHPDFISTFEQIRCVEKRRILDTLSEKMSALLENDVPEDEPGMISFDSYWENVANDAPARANADTKNVIDVVAHLDGKIDHGALKSIYVPTAHRVVNALAVHRLGQGDIASHVGLTAAEIREQLFIYDPDCAGEPNPAEALQELIAVAMKRLMQAVDGQYISRNQKNDQYYIDVHKTVDVDQLIEKRAEKLNPDELDRAYFAALCQLLEVSDSSAYVSGYKIWEYDSVRWFSRKTFRRGYLFFGSPDERSTAQPPRDYYIYFLRPFNPTVFKDAKKPDEVFFALKAIDDAFRGYIRRYAAAIALRDTETNSDIKHACADHAATALNAIGKWMREKGIDAFTVTHEGTQKKASNWLVGVDLRGLWGLLPDETFNYRDQVLALSGYLLENCFVEQAKGYPSFSRYVSAEARPNAVRDSLRQIAGHPTKQGAVLLNGLSLLDGTGSVVTSSSTYAAKIEAALDAAGAGKVVNRSDLVKTVYGTEFFDPDDARLEPELLVLLLAALTATGRIVLSIPGKDFSALELQKLSDADIADLVNFNHISRPKGGNSSGMEAAFRLVGLPASHVQHVMMDKHDSVIQLLTAVTERVNLAAPLIHRLGAGVFFMGIDILQQCGLTDAVTRISSAKAILEKIQSYNSIPKLKAIPLTKEEIDVEADNVKLIKVLEEITKFCDRQVPNIAWFEKASENCADDDQWRLAKEAKFTEIKSAIVAITKIADLAKRLKSVDAEFTALEREWIDHYTELHGRARLADGDDVKKQQIKNLPVLKTLTDLSQIDIVPTSELDAFRRQLNSLVICRDFSPKHLKSSPICTCGYSPKNDGTGVTARAVLDGMPHQLTALLAKWTDLILENLVSPKVKEQFDLLTVEERTAVEEVMEKRTLPATIPTPLLNGLKKALGGLEKIIVKADALSDKIKTLGPAEPIKVQKAVEDFFAAAVEGHDLAKVRIVVE